MMMPRSPSARILPRIHQKAYCGKGSPKHEVPHLKTTVEKLIALNPMNKIMCLLTGSNEEDCMK